MSLHGYSLCFGGAFLLMLVASIDDEPGLFDRLGFALVIATVGTSLIAIFDLIWGV